MSLALYYSIVLFFALVVMITALVYVLLKKSKENKLSNDIIFHFKQANEVPDLSEMIDFHKNINK